MNRGVLIVVLVVILVGLVGVYYYQTRPRPPATLVLSHWGFVWDEIDAAAIEPFEQEHNVEVVLVAGRTAERLTMLREGAEPIPDVIFLPDYYTYQAVQDDLLEKIDKSKLSNYGKLFSFIREQLPANVADYGVPHTPQDLALAYRSDLHDPITGWTDLWRGDFADYMTIPSITATSGPMTLIAASIAHGGSIDDVEPGFSALEDLSEDILTFYTSSAEPVSLFEREEIHICPVLRYQWGTLSQLNMSIEFVIPEEGSVIEFNLISIVKGSQNVDLAHELIDFWISTEVQRDLALAGVDAPVNSEVQLASDHVFYVKPAFDNAIYVNPAILADNLESWSDEWKESIEG